MYGNEVNKTIREAGLLVLLMGVIYEVTASVV
jgi:hypothetical protein